MLGHEGHEEETPPPEMEDPSPKYFKMTPPVMDADYSLGALFGDPEGVSCAMVAPFGFCDEPVIKSICQKTCGSPGDDYCHDDNDEMMMAYFSSLFGPGQLDLSDTTCKDLAPGGKRDKIINYPNGEQNFPCTDPALALLCPETCKTNCWSFPPLRATQVYLPGCHSTEGTASPTSMLIAKDAQRLMHKTVTDSSRVNQCPPTGTA